MLFDTHAHYDEEAESPETGKEELPKEEKASSLEGEIKIDIEF